MSTKLRKVYNKKDIKKAVEDNNLFLKGIRKIDNRKRRTVQIRISRDWHKKIKESDWFENQTLSSSIDRICKFYFKYHEY